MKKTILILILLTSLASGCRHHNKKHKHVKSRAEQVQLHVIEPQQTEEKKDLITKFIEEIKEDLQPKDEPKNIIPGEDKPEKESEKGWFW